ncbi:hypothetical protein EV421DRAFT_1905333 [Armillaria borealis]|uniref:Uncharacterized protein n=1 Tax=Armillaria borealis TaxID=47425 RepID=A0AA39JEP7_9AGAR|nr:hypothetical protein EV421DRAFT_1905333 [Armillaria borealis]
MSASGLNPRFKGIQGDELFGHNEAFLKGDQNEITVLANALCTLLNDHESFHLNLMCLITQASLAAVFRRSAISSILTPIRDIAVEFYGVTSAMWKEVYLFLQQGLYILRSKAESSHKNIANAEHHIRAAQVDYLRACQIIESRFEDLLWDKILLRLTKRYCSLSSYRLIVMEGIPRRLSMLWDDAREILACCHHLGEVMSRIQIRFRSPEWRAYYTGRADVIELFTKTFLYTSRWRDRAEHHIGCLYKYNSQELLIDDQYVGPWDPNGFVWDWYWCWG